MSNKPASVKPDRGGTAPLKNVAACQTVVETLIHRPRGLPGFGVFSGYSGYGKTVAAQYCQMKYQAVYLEVRATWSGSLFAEKLLHELDVHKPRGTIGTKIDQAIELLSYDADRPLIIDEADKLVDKKLIECVRDLAEGAQIPVLLVGEELLPKKLEECERVHNRVLAWELAQPCDLDDARLLADLICGDISLSDDLLTEIRRQSDGKARRISTNLHAVLEWSRHHPTDVVDLKTYDGEFVTGEAPRRHTYRKGGK